MDCRKMASREFVKPCWDLRGQEAHEFWGGSIPSQRKGAGGSYVFGCSSGGTAGCAMTGQKQQRAALVASARDGYKSVHLTLL